MITKLAVFGIVLVFALTSVAAFADPVMVKSKDGIGDYLTDAKGMTLYYFAKDSANTSACEGACLKNWPIFFDGKIKAPAGLSDKDFGSFTRGDEGYLPQSTFKGYPLYYFSGDKAAGDTNGQGFKGIWFVINPSTFKK